MSPCRILRRRHADSSFGSRPNLIIREGERVGTNFDAKKYKTEVNFKELPLSDNFMFGEVMRQPEICRMFLEELLQEEIERIEYVIKEDTVSDVPGYHGIRLDVFIKGTTKIYNVEMFGKHYQSYKPLPKRGRYYQSMMDRRTLEQGKSYRDLPDSYIIFVCDFDYLKTGLAVNERKTVIKGREDIEYDDGSHLYILNSEYKTRNASPAILEFLDFIRENNVNVPFKSALMQAICPKVKQIRSDPTKEAQFMVLETILEDKKYEGILIGRQEGRQEGFENAVVAMLRNLMKTNECTVEQAMASLMLPKSDLQKYTELLEAE